MADDGEEVLLYVYDLSNGFARLMSQGLLGKHIDGVWHTSVVVNGAEEVYFGQGIQRAVPGTTPHGQPLQIISLGCATYLGLCSKAVVVLNVCYAGLAVILILWCCTGGRMCRASCAKSTWQAWRAQTLRRIPTTSSGTTVTRSAPHTQNSSQAIAFR